MAIIRHGITSPSDVPAMSSFGGPHLVRFSGASHNERGYRAGTPEEIDHLNRHLAAKVEEHLDEIALVDVDLQDGADTLVVSYGITAGSAKEAVVQRGDLSDTEARI